MISGQTEGWKVERGEGHSQLKRGLATGTNGNQKLHAFQVTNVDFFSSPISYVDLFEIALP